MYSSHRFAFKCAHTQTHTQGQSHALLTRQGSLAQIVPISPTPRYGLQGVSLFWFVFYSYQDPGDWYGVQ